MKNYIPRHGVACAEWTITPFGEVEGAEGIGQLGSSLAAYFGAAGRVESADSGRVVGRSLPPTAPLIKGRPQLVVAHENESVFTPKQQSQLRVVGDPQTFRPDQLQAMSRAMDTYGTRGQRPHVGPTGIQPRRGESDNLNSDVVPQYARGGIVRQGGVTEKEQAPAWLQGRMKQLTFPEAPPPRAVASQPGMPVILTPPGVNRSNDFSPTPAFNQFAPKMPGGVPTFDQGGKVEGVPRKCPTCGRPFKSFGTGGLATMSFVTPGISARNDDDVGDWMNPILQAGEAIPTAAFHSMLAKTLNPPSPPSTV